MIRASTLALVLAGLPGALAEASPDAQPRAAVCEVKAITFRGWKAQEIANTWVTLTIVPQLGGRLMQVTFGDHDYLFVNDQLAGQSFTPEASAAQRKWFNYGGDKIWPLPEGNDDEQHWAGAVGSTLDTGVFSFEVLSQGAACRVRLVGPPDQQIGLQYTREITLAANAPEIKFVATMKNVTGYPVRWSAQSVSQYNAADPGNPAESNGDLWGFAPANPQSAYLNGYHVRTGPGSNPSYAVRDGLFALHWSDIGGEVWVDSPGPWVAVVDHRTSYAMIERFHYEPSAEYPDEATVIFFTTGQRTSSSRPTAPPDMPPRLRMHYMEAEINSPMIELAPGESYSMRTEWFPARVGRDFKAATYAGIVSTPLSASATPHGLVLAGEFGVFFPGRLVARFYDPRGLALGTAPVIDVNPLRLATLNATVQAPADTARVSVHLVDHQRLDRGPLGEVKVSQPSAANLPGGGE